MQPSELDSAFKPFFDAWASFREDSELLPAWKNFKPGRLAEMLPYIALVRRLERGDYRYRVLGSGLNDRFGGDPVDGNLLDQMDPRIKPFTTECLEAVVSTPCGGYSEFSAELAGDSTHSIKTLNLPMTGEDGTPSVYLYYSQMWPHLADMKRGKFVALGGRFVRIQAIDIGAGIPKNIIPEIRFDSASG